MAIRKERHGKPKAQAVERTASAKAAFGRFLR